MVLERKDRVGSPSFLMGKEKSSWNALSNEWALANAWSLGSLIANAGHTYFSLQNVGS